MGQLPMNVYSKNGLCLLATMDQLQNQGKWPMHPLQSVGMIQRNYSIDMIKDNQTLYICHQ